MDGRRPRRRRVDRRAVERAHARRRQHEQRAAGAEGVEVAGRLAQRAGADQHRVLDRRRRRKRETKALERGHAAPSLYSLVRGGTRMPSSESCSGSTGDGACIIRSTAEAVLGNAITSRMLALPASSITSRSSPTAMPPCGGAPKRKRVEQEAESLARFGGGDAEDAEHPLLQLGVVDTDRAAGELDAVEHDVVGERARRRRIAVEQRQVLGVRMGERVMHGAEAALVRAPLDQRKVGHPQQPVAFGPVTILLGERHAQLTQRRRRARARRGDQQREVAFGELRDAPPPLRARPR